MKINGNLDALLFDRDKGQENENKFYFDTQSIYDSLDIQDEVPHKPLDYYVIPYNKKTSTINNQEKISEFSLKDKIMKISTTLKSLNILLKPRSSKISFDVLSNGVENFMKNKNLLINFLLDFIVELIWKIKDENSYKDSLIEKINYLSVQKEDFEKKFKRMNSELSDNKREVSRMNTSVLSKKEKLEKLKKVKDNENQEIKLENKKLNNLLQCYKNEIKKKEMEYARIQEKIKKLLHSPLPKNQFFELGNIISKNNYIDSETGKELEVEISDNKLTDNKFHETATKTIYQNTINEFNNHKYEMIVNQNYYLMNILKNLQTSFDNLLKVSSDVQNNFNKGPSSIDENVIETFGNLKNLDFNEIKENIFSIHLLENNLLEEFYEKFVNNFNRYEEFILKILDIRLNRKYQENETKSKTKNLRSFNHSMIIKADEISLNEDRDILKNFKKWSNNNRSVRYGGRILDNLDKSKDTNVLYDDSIG